MAEGTLGLILAGVSTAATVYSAVSSSQAESHAEHTAKRQAQRAAEEARKAAFQKAEDEEQRHRRLMATGRARYAASGVEFEGTPLLVEMESLRESEEQLRRIREGGEVEATTLEELAQAAGKRASSAKTSGYVEATGKLAGGTYKYGQARDWWT